MICEPLLPANAQTTNRRQWLQEIGLSIDIYKRRGPPLAEPLRLVLPLQSVLLPENGIGVHQGPQLKHIVDRSRIATLVAGSGEAPRAAFGWFARQPNRREPSDEASPFQSATDINERRCYALADHAHILMPDLDALRTGVQAGHSRSYALALTPGLKLLAADATRETHAFEAIALALRTYTPKVSLADTNTLLLEVGSGLRLFGALRTLLSRVSGTVVEFGYTAHIACSPTA
jgi:hypothetical protein